MRLALRILAKYTNDKLIIPTTALGEMFLIII